MRAIGFLFSAVLQAGLTSGSNEARIRREAGGYEAAEGEFPYQANLVVRSVFDSDENTCSASVIHERWLLTAAHCLVDLAYPRHLLVTVGTNEFSGDGGTSLQPELHIVHDHWCGNPTNDIGLVRLKENIIFNDKVRMIKLQMDNGYNYENHTATLSSWGKTKSSQPNRKLQKKRYAVIGEEKCRMELEALTALSHISTVDHEFFVKAILGLPELLCTNRIKRGGRLCHGDSGGPLVINGTQIGIVSSSYKCTGVPALFTRVSRYIDWIQSQLDKFSDKLPQGDSD